MFDHSFKTWIFSILLIALHSLPQALSDTPTSNNWPTRPVKVVVPFGAGGGSDTFARQLIRAIEKQQLLGQPMIVINVGGAGGTIGSRRVRQARPDGYTMLMLHEGMLTARYAGKAAYGPEAFEAVAGTGRIGVVVTVNQNSEIQDFKTLMKQVKNQPGSLNFAANLGAPSHFIGLMMEKSNPGSQFNFVQYGGGADRYGAIMGDHAQLSIFSVEEYLRYKDGGLKALAVFSKERHPAIPKVATALEQGFDVDCTNMHFWWMPKGTPQHIQSKMAHVIQQAMLSEEMQSFMKTSWTEPLCLTSEDLANELQQRENRISQVSLRKTNVLPDFPIYIIASIIVLSLLAGWRYFMSEKGHLSRQKWSSTSTLAFFVTSTYVLLLSLEIGSYLILTIPYLFILGTIVAKEPKKAIFPLLAFSFSLAFGLFYIFTKILIVDLPG